MKKLKLIGTIGLVLVTLISVALWPSGGHVVSLPFAIPFAVMLLIAFSTRRKR